MNSKFLIEVVPNRNQTVKFLQNNFFEVLLSDCSWSGKGFPVPWLGSTALR